MLPELFLQLLDYRREFALTPFFNLLAKLLLNATSLLHVTPFKLGAPLRLKFQTGLTERRVCIPLNARAALSLALAEQTPLLWTHLQPAFGI